MVWQMEDTSHKATSYRQKQSERHDSMDCEAAGSDDNQSERHGSMECKTTVSDENQYELFNDELCMDSETWESQSELSFALSGESEEASQFEAALPEIIEVVDRAQIPWQSINCLGRVTMPEAESKAKKIRSTVVIGVSSQQFPDPIHTSDLQKRLETICKLPVKISKGENELSSHFGFQNHFMPPMSGSSCCDGYNIGHML